MPPKLSFLSVGKAYQSPPENAQLSNIFSDLMVDLATKDLEPPTGLHGIKVDEDLNKSILQRTMRVSKHSSFGILSMKGKTHEDFLVGWAKLEGSPSPFDKAKWEELMNDVNEILGDIGDADAEA